MSVLPEIAASVFVAVAYLGVPLVAAYIMSGRDHD